MSTLATTRRRLVIPLDRSPPTERLLLVKPWFLRAANEPVFLHAKGAEQHAAPEIISFTTDDFIEAFFAGVDGHTVETVADMFEAPNRFRDWSEPPRAMLDLHGAPRYPGTVTRHEPIRALQATDASDPVDGDGIPTDTPAWLRKLYLPLHRHHQIVSTEVICRRWDAPRVRADRILGAGMVLRRLIPETQPEKAGVQPERWEDWIPAPTADGVWLEIADGEMVAHADGTTLDPEALPAALFGSDEQRSSLAERLGLALPRDEKGDPIQDAVDALLPTRLPSHLLSPIPGAHGESSAHSAFFGYLPLASSDLILPETLPTSRDALRQLLARRARRRLALAWFDLSLDDAQAAATVTLSTTARAHFEDTYRAVPDKLVQLVDALLRPTIPDGFGASLGHFQNHHGLGLQHQPGNWRSGLDAVLDAALDRSLTSWWGLANEDDEGLDADGWWTRSGADPSPRATAIEDLKATLTAGTFASTEPFASTAGLAAWMLEAFDAATDEELGDVLTERMHRAVAAVSGGTGTAAFRGAQRRQALALLLRRVRAVRRTLGQTIGEVVFDPADVPDLTATRVIHKDATTELVVPVLTVSSLTDEIDAWRSADEERGTWPRPWGPYGLDAARESVHDTCAELERLFTDLFERSSGAGSAFAERIAENASALDALFGASQQRLCEHGLDVQEQPLLGLLVFPGPEPTATAARTFLEEIVDRYETASRRAVKAEREALARTPQPRFDSRSLYAVWCWVRVQAPSPCEQDHLVWTRRSEPFSMADATDLLGARPVAFQLPDLKQMVRDIPRIAKAGANPFAAVTTPPDSGVSTGESMADTARTWGIGWVCSFGIPVFTICAWILFTIILSILLMIPGFGWLLLLKFCVPAPTKE